MPADGAGRRRWMTYAVVAAYPTQVYWFERVRAANTLALSPSG